MECFDDMIRYICRKLCMKTENDAAINKNPHPSIIHDDIKVERMVNQWQTDMYAQNPHLYTIPLSILDKQREIFKRQLRDAKQPR